LIIELIFGVNYHATPRRRAPSVARSRSKRRFKFGRKTFRDVPTVGRTGPIRHAKDQGPGYHFRANNNILVHDLSRTTSLSVYKFTAPEFSNVRFQANSACLWVGQCAPLSRRHDESARFTGITI
jgi:hypothetical protein